MGVPKFFRWISERYPCLSELVKEYQIPEFDNLYLDMNGIIHTCSHPNDFDPHFRITEEKIFKDIFHYIEILFRMIQPQKLFFMAVDGVAPRAKQNQQRGRRFRSAKEAEELEKKAREKGEELPSAARFDSNCITPGTPFMVRLQAQLKFFVAYKISTDDLWQKCKIILSGHETPGEGEHKIMDYIRYMKSQPDYDSDTRHCLYGLDADLIMLGLCSHEPHFSLLREEVRFDKKSSNQRITTPEETTFFLLHLSLMREYLEHEFSPVKDRLADDFAFDLECIIDDWVLMGFLVGNDFIPPLPELHINTGALPILYKTYMDVLPSLGGYINEGGTLNLPRFQRYMAALGRFDTQQFDDKFADLQYFKEKTGRRPDRSQRTSYKKKLTPFEVDDSEDGIGFKFAALEQEKPKNRDLEQLIASTNELLVDGSASDSESSPVDDGDDSTASEEETLIQAEFRQHKQDYYMNKLQYKEVTREVLRSQAEGYVRAVQWNLNYYYNGVCSWSWFYPHHYSPYISDIRDFADLKLTFDMGRPFLPFQQLAAVLPAASKELLPEAYQWLMVDPASPIIRYYPADFETDLNGKRQEWEAVVLIPFIDETDLLSAMADCGERLTAEERERNSHGPMSVFEFAADDQGAVEAPAYFPTLTHSHARLTLVDREDIFVEQSELVKGLCPGTRLDVFFPGFPTLKHVAHTGKLGKGKVKVFEMPARGENMLLTIKPLPAADLKVVAAELLGRSIYVQWPHLTEALVTSVWGPEHRCDLVAGQVKVATLTLDELSAGRASRKAIAEDYANRRGVVVGDTPVLLRAQAMIGRKYTVGAHATTVTLEKQWAAIASPYALQATVRDIAVNDATFVRFKTVSEVFPVGSVCFMLSPDSRYGHMGEVVDGGKAGRIKLRLAEAADADLAVAKQLQHRVRTTYMQGSAAGARLGISSFLMSRVTGNLFVSPTQPPGEFNPAQHRSNVGLSLKFTKRNEEIPGYTRRDLNGSGWLYSQKAVELVNSYMEAFPALFDYLAAQTNNDDFAEDDIFPDKPGQIAAIVAWMKQQPYAKVERQTCGSNCLEAEVVAAIEAELDKEPTSEQRTLLQVKPYLLYKPELHTGNLPPDLTATYALFDRVINVRKSFTVPLGLKGVVIGIHKQAKEEETLYDVVFDSAFPGGLALNTSPGRSYRMPRCALINVSHGKRLEDGIVQSSDALNAAFAPVDRSRPLPHARVFDNAGMNGVPRQVGRQQQQQNWRSKSDAAPAAATPTYTLLSKPSPAGAAGAAESWRETAAPPKDKDFTAMWESMVAGGDQAKPAAPPPQGTPAGGAKPRKVTETLDSIGPNCDNATAGTTTPLNKKSAKSKTSQGNKLKAGDLGTDALKMMLGIPAPKVKQSKARPTQVQATTPVLVQDMFRHHALAQPDSANASTRLLTAFQAQGLGIPRYTYTDCAAGAVCATVQLPNGRFYVGPPAPTRQEASFGAAQLALDQLGAPPPRAVVADHLPAPPQQWWQQQQQQVYQPPAYAAMPPQFHQQVYQPSMQPSPLFQQPPMFHPQQPLYEPPRSKPAGAPRSQTTPNTKSRNYGPFPQAAAHFSPTKPFSPLHVAFSAHQPPAFSAPVLPSTSNKQQKPPTQRLIRVTGAPPAPRERSTTPTFETETRPQVAVGVGRGTSIQGHKKPKRIAANFKAARKASTPAADS